MAAIALPLFFYTIIGISRAAEPVPGGGTVGGYLVVVFGIFGVLSVSLSGIGHTIADERARGDLRLMRVTPMPAAAYLAAKLVFVLLASAAIIVLLGIEGAVTGARLPLDTWLATAGLLLAGSLALAPIGFLVGFLVRPSSAGAVNLLILMPLSLTAGVFIDVDHSAGSRPPGCRVHPDVSPVHARAVDDRAAGRGPAHRRSRLGRRLGHRVRRRRAPRVPADRGKAVRVGRPVSTMERMSMASRSRRSARRGSGSPPPADAAAIGAPSDVWVRSLPLWHAWNIGRSSSRRRSRCSPGA